MTSTSVYTNDLQSGRSVPQNPIRLGREVQPNEQWRVISTGHSSNVKQDAGWRPYATHPRGGQWVEVRVAPRRSIETVAWSDAIGRVFADESDYDGSSIVEVGRALGSGPWIRFDNDAVQRPVPYSIDVYCR